MTLYWLSFADGDRPKGTQFLGACIVEGGNSGDKRADLRAAVQNAWLHGCNPGGEVMSLRLPADVQIDEGWRNRLLSRAECEAFDRRDDPLPGEPPSQ